MVVFPNAKINLGLNILNKRKDGYHGVETCFYPVPWRDALEIIESDKTFVTTSGSPIPDDGDNIVLKAYHLLATDFALPPLHIHLHKEIPIGAGLGGGSADAAFMLRLLNSQYNLGIDDEALKKYAVRLGADCAFFMENKPILAAGIGEKLEAIDISLAGKYILLIYPDIHISTKEAYSGISPRKPERDIKSILSEEPITSWKDHLNNDFEGHLFQKYPILKSLKKHLYFMGASYAVMTGSGSCMFGIFDERPDATFPKSYKTFVGKL